MVTTFLIRVASRSSFVILSFYLGENFTSTSIIALVIDAYFVSELVLAPFTGKLSDTKGRKPFLLLAPLLGGGASLVLLLGAFIFPSPDTTKFDFSLVILLFMILCGELLEGAAASFNSPAILGYIADSTEGAEKFRTRFMTAYQVATVLGIALGIPFGGLLWSTLKLERSGFLVVLILYLLCFGLVYLFIKETWEKPVRQEKHSTLRESLVVLKEKRLQSFIPAWFSIMALLGAWSGLILIILTYPTTGNDPGTNADLRFPGQLLYGGFNKETATLIFAGYGILYICGMGLWSLIHPNFRRTTLMLIGLSGTLISSAALVVLNSLADNPGNFPQNLYFPAGIAIILGGLGILIQGCFTPAALSHLGALSEIIAGKRGLIMGLFWVLLGIGQLIGTWAGGVFVDIAGFNGLMIYSVVLTFISFGAVYYMRQKKHDL